MDAVELTFPLDVAAAPKMMGSEGFLGAGVTVKEVEMEVHRRGSDRVSVIVSHSMERCNPRIVENDAADMKNDAESPSRNEFLETQPCKNSSQLPHLQGGQVSKNVPGGNVKNCHGLKGMQLQRKATKVNRSNSSCSKKPRMSKSEDSTSLNGNEKSKDIPDKLGSHHIKCLSLGKSQLPKQKSYATKRGDKRNFKVPSSKTKSESSSMKLGTAIFSSTCGGLYGLKHDMHDVTKLMNEPPLDELLRGTFDCPSLSQDKGKKASNMNGSFLNSVRKACSILQFPKSVQSQSMAAVDSSSDTKMSACHLSSVCAVESVSDGDNEQSCTSDMSSRQKDPSVQTGSPASPLDFPLCRPKYVLERIALPPSPDLESLLPDVSKPALTTKSSNNLRSSKQVSRRPSLPAFPWSHAFVGHSRINSDTVKSSTSRSTCKGKWARIGIIASPEDIDRGCFTNLDSFSYDQSLVPSTDSSENKVFPSLFASLPFCQSDSSSPVTCSKDSQVTSEFGGQMDNKEDDEHCPRLLVAARTLYELSTHSPGQNRDGIIKWQKKTSHKTEKACNIRSTEKLEDMLSTPVSVIGSGLVAKSVEQISPSKKPRLSIGENKNGGHSNNVKKGPCTWPTSKSSRSLPSKPIRESFVENKHSTASILKQHRMMPPPNRVLDKVYDGKQKVGKLVLLDWKRGRDKLD